MCLFLMEKIKIWYNLIEKVLYLFISVRVWIKEVSLSKSTKLLRFEENIKFGCFFLIIASDLDLLIFFIILLLLEFELFIYCSLLSIVRLNCFSLDSFSKNFFSFSFEEFKCLFLWWMFSLNGVLVCDWKEVSMSLLLCTTHLF